MAYDDPFYVQYLKYIKEDSIRRAHDSVLGMTKSNRAFSNVVDLGCGQFNEFRRYRRPAKYLGIDLNVTESAKPNRRLVSGDYRCTDLVSRCIKEQSATGFVSLFSSEITAPTATNYAFYESVFRHNPGISAGLVSGFYYWNSKDKNPIGETGGILSYQTLEQIEDVRCDLFHETRILLPAPSAMFGRDVIEIWKILERK